MEFSIVANNLFDKAYLSAITENAAWLGAPRTISMTVKISFWRYRCRRTGACPECAHTPKRLLAGANYLRHD